MGAEHASATPAAPRRAEPETRRPKASNVAPSWSRLATYVPPGELLTPELEASLRRTRGTGRPLDPDPRRRLSGGLGDGIADARIHTGPSADSLARSLDARAFTFGRDVYFRSGEYRPEAATGDALLAHELTHVLQQGAAPRTGRTAITDPAHRSEQEAATTSTRVLAGARGSHAGVTPLPAQAIQRVGGWTGVPATSPNAGEQVVGATGGRGGARRIPIEGVAGGTLGGRAIVVIPVDLPATATQVDVLLHFHGFEGGGVGAGYLPGRLAPRDISLDRIEAQVAAASAAGSTPIIAVLPQGTGHSSFGSGPQGSFDPNAYLNSVFTVLDGLHAWGARTAPTRGRLILSSHSGGEWPLYEILSTRAYRPLLATLAELVIFDNMWPGGTEEGRVMSFVRFRLGLDLDQLRAVRTSMAGQPESAIETALVDWVRAHGFRLYGFRATASSYASSWNRLAADLETWRGSRAAVAVLGGTGSALSRAVKDNLVIQQAGAEHNYVLGSRDNLRTALEHLPGRTPSAPPAATGTTGTTPAGQSGGTTSPPPVHSRTSGAATHAGGAATQTVPQTSTRQTAPQTTTATLGAPPHAAATQPAADPPIVARVVGQARPVVGTAAGVDLWPLIRDQFAHPRTRRRTHPAAGSPLIAVNDELYSTTSVAELQAMNTAARRSALNSIFDQLAPTIAAPEPGATAPTAAAEIAAEEALVSARIRDHSEGGWRGVRRGLLAAFGVFEVGTRTAIDRANTYYGSLVTPNLLGIHSGSLVHPVLQARLALANDFIDQHHAAEKNAVIASTNRSIGGFWIRPNSNNQWVLSNHSFGWAIDIDANRNPNFGRPEDPAAVADVAAVTGRGDPLAAATDTTGRSTADVERIATTVGTTSTAFVAAMQDDASIARALREMANRARTAAGLAALGGDGSDLLTAAGTGAPRNLGAVATLVTAGAPTPQDARLQSAAAAVLSAVRTYRASFHGHGRTAAQAVSPTRGSIAAHGFMNLHPLLVAALAGSDAGNLVWLGSNQVHDFMHFELPAAARPSLTAPAATQAAPTTSTTQTTQTTQTAPTAPPTTPPPVAVQGTRDPNEPHPGVGSGGGGTSTPATTQPVTTQPATTQPTTTQPTGTQSTAHPAPEQHDPVGTTTGTQHRPPPEPGAGVTLTHDQIRWLDRNPHVVDFYRRYIADMLIAQKQSGIPALFTLAQAAVESGWGRHMRGNMLFGVTTGTRGVPASQRQLLLTSETVTQRGIDAFRRSGEAPGARAEDPRAFQITESHPILDRTTHQQQVDSHGNPLFQIQIYRWFRRYASNVEAIAHHSQVLAEPRYRHAFDHTDDPEAFAVAVAAAGYATGESSNHAYSRELVATIRILNRVAAYLKHKSQQTTGSGQQATTSGAAR